MRTVLTAMSLATIAMEWIVLAFAGEPHTAVDALADLAFLLLALIFALLAVAWRPDR